MLITRRIKSGETGPKRHHLEGTAALRSGVRRNGIKVWGGTTLSPTSVHVHLTHAQPPAAASVSLLGSLPSFSNHPTLLVLTPNLCKPPERSHSVAVPL